MNKEFELLVREVATSIKENPNYLMTKVKIMDSLQLLMDTELSGVDFLNSLVLLFHICKVSLDKDCMEIFEQCVDKAVLGLQNCIVEEKNKEPFKKISFTERDFSKAIKPLTLCGSIVHKTGNIVHFIENHYTDETGRGFVEIVKPNYDEAQSILQYDLTKLLEGGL